jgi:hypothetical protein
MPVCGQYRAEEAKKIASFREVALGRRRTFENEGEVVLEPPKGSPEDGVAPDILFLKVPEAQLDSLNNRPHLDLIRPGGDQRVWLPKSDLGKFPKGAHGGRLR